MRYLPLTSDDRHAMLAKIGAPDVDALFRDVPKPALAPLSLFNLPDTQGEMEVERQKMSRRERPHFSVAPALTSIMCPVRWIT
jgi:glycine dehydrogenase subunit 1